MSHALAYINARFQNAGRIALLAAAFSGAGLIFVGVGVMLAEPSPADRDQRPTNTLAEDEVEWRQLCYDLYLDPARTDLAGNSLPADDVAWAACIAGA